VRIGGEAMSPESINVWKKANLENVTLLNTYGPTEAVATASVSDCADYISGARVLPQQMPIGSPLAGRDLYVLDAGLTQVPAGVAGELCIGGELLARGYLGRQTLTAQSFIADPFSEYGGRLYRTGDLVRWNNNGELEYLGRIDHQVKIRGFRIELGEIESELLKQKDVSEAVVVAKASQSGTRLVAYVSASADGILNTTELKVILGQSLPDYMVPSIIVLLDALPLNPNGKIDRKALPEPEFVSNNEYAAPEEGVEACLAKIWCEVLGVEQVGRYDNFFVLGGDSIQALKVVTCARKQGLKFKPKDLLANPTIVGLLELDNKKSPLLLMNTHKNEKPALFCIHAIMGTVFDYQPLANQLQGDRALYALPCRTFTDPSYKDVSLEQMALDYCQIIRDKQAQGPYALFGWSLGAALAAMVAALLEAAGQQVEFLGLVDSFIPNINGLPLVTWQSNFIGYLNVVLPQVATAHVIEVLAKVYPGNEQALMPDTVLLEKTIANILASLVTEPEVSDEQEVGYAAMGSNGLIEIFMMGRHLKELSCHCITLPKLEVKPHYWWVADRPESDKKQLLALFDQEISQDVVLDTDHFSIIRDERLIKKVESLLATNENKALKESKTLA